MEGWGKPGAQGARDVDTHQKLHILDSPRKHMYE